MLSHCAGDTVQSCLKDQIYMHTMTSYRRFNLYITRLLFCYDIRKEQKRTEQKFYLLRLVHIYIIIQNM